MKTYFVTATWSVEEALAIVRFLDELRDVFCTSYSFEFERHFEAQQRRQSENYQWCQIDWIDDPTEEKLYELFPF